MAFRTLFFSVVFLGALVACVLLVCMIKFEQQPSSRNKGANGAKDAQVSYSMNADGSIVLGSKVGDDGVVHSGVISK